jgi:hypothetical protein
MNKSDFVRKVWRQTKFVAIAAPIVVFLIVGMNLWHNYEKGEPLDTESIFFAGGFLLWTGLIYLFCRTIFKFAIQHSDRDERRL